MPAAILVAEAKGNGSGRVRVLVMDTVGPEVFSPKLSAVCRPPISSR